MRLIKEKKLPVQDRVFKVEVTGTELMMMHAGLYMLTPSDANRIGKNVFDVDLKIKQIDSFPHDNIFKILKDAMNE